ncbi:MAG: hypothetical protein II180_09160 [Proteobacteria bacterium]|nr:hypothetical protein [Pseudomonadota bacterium]
MSQISFLNESAGTLWRGRAAVLWPIFSAGALTILRLGLIFWCAGAALYMTGGSAPYWGALLGLTVASGVIFYAACEIAWWRTFIAAAGIPSPHRWVRDLPAMLAIDIIFGCIRYACLTAAAVCAIGGMIFLAALGALVAFVGAILQPAVTAQKLVTNAPLALCARDAAIVCLRKPFAALAAHFLPGILSTAFGMAALICALAQYIVPCLVLALLAALVPLVQPALWVTMIKK